MRMLYLAPASYWFVASATLQLCGWRQYVFPECQWTSSDPHDFTIEKTVLFRVTAVITKVQQVECVTSSVRGPYIFMARYLNTRKILPFIIFNVTRRNV